MTLKKALINGADGKMGQAIAHIMRQHPELGLTPTLLRGPGQKITDPFDIVIDFSSPEGAVEAFYLAKDRRKPFLTGTTNLPETFLFQMQEEEKIPVFYSPNVSLSVYFFTELAKTAAKMCAGYEVNIHEIHHTQKKDAPSGTAKKIAEALDIPLAGVTWQRTGTNVGTHIVTLSSPLDCITLSHQALNRDLFADSAVHIAAWLLKRGGGFYTMSDYAKFKFKEKIK